MSRLSPGVYLAPVCLALASVGLACARPTEVGEKTRPAPAPANVEWTGSATGAAVPEGSAFTVDQVGTGPLKRIPPLPHGEGVKRMNTWLDMIVKNMDPTRNI